MGHHSKASETRRKLQAALRRCALLSAAATALTCESLVGADFDDVHPRRPPADSGEAGGPTHTSDGTDGGARTDGAAGSEAGLTGSEEPGDSAGSGFVAGSGGGAPDPGTAGGGGAPDPGTTGGGGEPCAGFERVELMAAPTDGTVPARLLAEGLGVLDSTLSHGRCQGALVAGSWLLTIDCGVSVHDTFAFEPEYDAQNPDGTPTHDEYAVSSVESGERHEFVNVGRFPAWPRIRLPWEARDPLPDEVLTVITHRDDGLARGARITSPSPELFRDNGGPAPDSSEMSAVFSSDGKLLGFCAFDACAEPRDCVSVASIVATSVNVRKYYAMRGVFLADVTGDRSADATVINAVAPAVRRSNGASFLPKEAWMSSTAYYGTRQNILRDFDGDDDADFAVVNESSVAVSLSTANAFSTSTTWLGEPFYGVGGTLAGDVDGLSGADLAIIDGSSVLVRRSSSASFGASEEWAREFSSNFRSAELSDVTGDGLADLVVVRGDTIEVLRSTRTRFEQPEIWLDGVAIGAPGWFFADVTGEGAADAIALDFTGLKVFRSEATGFYPPLEPWSGTLAVGERANYFVDVTGDDIADAVTVNHANIVVNSSTGTGFLPRQFWAEKEYYGGL